MLLCVDQERNIKVFRVTDDADGVTKRERLGVVPKKDFAIGEDFNSLSQEESDELAAVIKIYNDAAEARLKSSVLSFPQTSREVIAYIENGATEQERKLIITAFMEGFRHIRRMNK